MMFKRSRLRLVKGLVNARLAIGMIFLAAACSEPAAPPQDSPPKPSSLSTSNASEQANVELPIIWGSQPLAGPIVDIGLAADGLARLFVVYADGTAQILDLEGDPITQAAPLDVQYVDAGHEVTFEGLPLIVFPGADSLARPQLFAVSADLTSPLALDLPLPDQTIAGLCSATPNLLAGDAHLFRLNYWTDTRPSRQLLGHILQEDGEILWQKVNELPADGTQKACTLGRKPQPTSEKSISTLDYGSQSFTIELSSDGDLFIGEDGPDARTHILQLRPGITVPAPRTITAIASAPRIRVGGYPNGIIVVAGEVNEGDHRVVFIDPSALIADGAS